MQKTIGTIMVLGAVFLTVWLIKSDLSANNDYNNKIGNYWTLADRSSTIDAKADYMNKYVSALENSNLSGNNAVFYKNPGNSFEYNLLAVKTLQNRLEEIKGMNPASFEYQQAISQITTQEQGEAEDMTNTFYGIWYLNNHPLLWGWYEMLVIMGLILMGLIGVSVIDDAGY